MSDYIPEDIQVTILKHLPAETLIRFRCVCKWWKQLIDSEPFIQDHLALQKPQLIVEYEEHEFLLADPCILPSFDTLISPKQDERAERLHLVGTLHGIICLYHEYGDQFLLWNPWLRKLIRVKSGARLDWAVYDSEDSIGHCAGFWIDPCTKDFKILVFRLFGPEEEGDAYEVYSSTRRDWKDYPLGELEMYYNTDVAPPVVMDGVGYWTAFSNFTDNEGQKMVSVVVLPFDFVQEIFCDPIYALSVREGWNRPVLCNQDGALSLVYMDPEKSCHMYLRKEDSWVVVFGIDLLPGVSRVLWGMLEGEDARVLATRSGELVLFDSQTMICTPLKSGLKNSNDVVIANGFVWSLLFPQKSFGFYRRSLKAYGHRRSMNPGTTSRPSTSNPNSTSSMTLLNQRIFSPSALALGTRVLRLVWSQGGLVPSRILPGLKKPLSECLGSSAAALAMLVSLVRSAVPLRCRGSGGVTP